jgi:Uncharacterized protein conserved in bacteria (DUF2252)
LFPTTGSKACRRSGTPVSEANKADDRRADDRLLSGNVGNLGPLADAKGRVLIQIRDLDQTVIGNPAHDLIRLGLPLASASRGSDLPGVTTAKILEELVAGSGRSQGRHWPLQRLRGEFLPCRQSFFVYFRYLPAVSLRPPPAQTTKCRPISECLPDARSLLDLNSRRLCRKSRRGDHPGIGSGDCCPARG